MAHLHPHFMSRNAQLSAQKSIEKFYARPMTSRLTPAERQTYKMRMLHEKALLKKERLSKSK